MRKLTWLLIIGFFANSCANEMAPTGGPKDEDPPILLKSLPPDKTLNFKGQTLEFSFDESIQLVSLKNELIITPTYKGEFKDRSTKDGFILEFDTPFDDSTTYSFNFRNAVQDLTEGNSVENFTLAFSTWDFFDSLEISGHVKDLLTKSLKEEVTIGLYKANDTLNVFNSPPLYFGKTDASGHFLIQNVKSNTYNVFAFNDKNDNLKLDSRSEAYGFLTEPITLDSSYMDLNFEIQALDLTELAILSARQNGQYFEIKSPKYITDYQLVNLSDTSKILSKLSDGNKTIVVFNTIQNVNDSIQTLVQLTDSLYKTVVDTIYLKFEESNRKPDEFQFALRKAEIDKATQQVQSTFSFNKPISQIVLDSIYIEWDSLIVSPILGTDLIKDSISFDYHLYKNIDQNLFDSLLASVYSPVLKINESAFISIEMDTSTSISNDLKITEIKDVGTIKGKIENDSTHFFIQLLSPNHVLIDFRENESEYSFENLEPGGYLIRVLVDSNNNGRWDPGNILENIAPEPVVYYSDGEGRTELTLRANWELVDIDILKPVEMSVDSVDSVDINNAEINEQPKNDN